MKTIIIGAGKVGYSMAQMLSGEEHDVVIIEQDPERQKVVDDMLDVQVIHGSGSSRSVLESAGVKNATMLLAVTQYDELNMIACLLAKQYGVKTTVARVRNTEYLEVENLGKLMGIDLFINPERVTAMEIAEIVKYPEALNIDYYADGKVQLIELKIGENSCIIGKKLRELETFVPYNIVSIMRKKKVIIPNGDDTFYPGDRINVMAKSSDIRDVERVLGINRRKVDTVTILGGGRTGYYLAQILEHHRPAVNIKIIERDLKRAREISEKLNSTLVIHGDGGDYDLLESENIGASDLFVAVTNDDKINLLCSLIAKNLGVAKTISQVKRSDVMPLVEQIGIDIVLSPRILTAGAILKYIRRGDIVSVTVTGDEQSEILELFVQPGSTAVNKQIQNIKFPSGAVIGAIVRGNEVIIPSGREVVKAFDRIMVFTLPKSIHKVEKLFLNGGRKA